MVIILLIKIILIWTCIWSNYIILENKHFINVVLLSNFRIKVFLHLYVHAFIYKSIKNLCVFHTHN